MSLKKNQLLAVLAVLLCSAAPLARGQNITLRGGASTTLYDKKYFPDLYGEGVNPVFASFGARLGWQDFSGSAISEFCNHPELGIGVQVDALAAFKTDKSPGIGNIYSLYGYFDRPLIVAGHFRFGYTLGAGIGCSFSRLFDPQHNPANRLLSLPVNARISLGLQAKYDVSPRYYIGTGVYFNHTSNGAVKFPNRGVNAFELSLFAGMKKRPGNVGWTGTVTEEEESFRRRFRLDLQLTGGIMSNEAYFYHRLEQDGVSDNAYRFKWSLSAIGLYQYSRMHATGLGIDMFVTPFCDEIARYDGRETAYSPVSVGISLQHEMRYGHLALMPGLGRYLYDNDGLARNKKYYQTVTLRYHMPELAGVFVGCVLKAHKFMAAESVQLCLGKRF